MLKKMNFQIEYISTHCLEVIQLQYSTKKNNANRLNGIIYFVTSKDTR
jgi:hypothetical protein